MCLTNCNSLWILFFILPDSSTAACARIRARSHHLLLDLRCGLLGKWWAQSTETGWRLPNKGWHARSTLIYPLHSTHKPSTALCYSAELCSASKSTGCRKQKKKKTAQLFVKPTRNHPKGLCLHTRQPKVTSPKIQLKYTVSNWIEK